MKKNFWTTVVLSLAYLGLALACLLRWGQPEPWLRVDLFSLGYLTLRFLGSLYSLISSRDVFRSTPVMREWWALNSDPHGPRWVMALMALDLLAFLEYGHGPFVLALKRPTLQALGLALYLAISAWQIWTDAHLARFFSLDEAPSTPMVRGPYRYVRHPRYAAAILGKVAMALVLASVVGWMLVIAWGLLLTKKIAVEERHLRELFGSHYDSYAQSTAKIIPGIY
jgi:methyltransferase